MVLVVKGAKIRTYIVSIGTDTDDDLAWKIILLINLIQPDDGIDWRHLEVGPGAR